MTGCLRIVEGGEVQQSIDLDMSAFACDVGGDEDAPRVFIMAAEWAGPEGVDSGPKTGQVLRVAAPVPRSLAAETR